MDQLRKAMAVLKKHYFWFASTLCLLLSIAAWFLATGKLSAQAQTERGKLESVFGQLKQIRDQANHPNEKFPAAILRGQGALEETSLRTHHMLHERQKQLFKLPEGISEELLKRLQTDMQAKQISNDTRAILMNETRSMWESLFKTIDLREAVKESDEKTDPAESPMTVGLTPVSGQESATKKRVYKGMVVWQAEQREKIVKHYDWKKTPTDLQVRLAFEDYCAYRELLRVIEACNESAQDHLAATVKEIALLEIGQDASGGSSGLRSGAPIIAMVGEDKKADTNRGGGGQPKDDDPAALLDARYVNEEGVPLAMNDKQPFPQFKLLPFKIELVVDQRQVPRVLSKFANARLPLEIWQCSFNPGKAFNPLAGGERRTSTGSKDTGAWGKVGSPGVEQTYHDTLLSLVGCMYLYEPPPADKLAKLLEADAAAAAAAAAKNGAAPPPKPGSNEPPPATPTPEPAPAPETDSPAKPAPAVENNKEPAPPAPKTVPPAAGQPAAAGGG